MLWIIGVLQPVSPDEICEYLKIVFEDITQIPRVEDIRQFCLSQVSARYLVQLSDDSNLFSLTHLGNLYLPPSQRKLRDIKRIFLLKEAYKVRIPASREVNAIGLGGESPSVDLKPSSEGRESNKTGLAALRPVQFYWTRFSKQLLDQTGSLQTSRDIPLEYLSFYSLSELTSVCRSEEEIKDINQHVSSITIGMMLGISPSLVYQIALQPERHYTSFYLPKRGGGQRLIESPRVFLKTIQRFIMDYLLYKLPVSSCVFSFRSGVSIFDNATHHVGKAFVAGIDIENFFGSITKSQVSELLCSSGFNEESARIISSLVTKDDVLPQGAPTSPIISNAFLYDFDKKLIEICKVLKLTYSRYADDITISGDDRDSIYSIIELAKVELKRDYNLLLNQQKTRISTRYSQQKVTGLVVNDEKLSPRPPRKFRRRVRAAFHNAKMRETVSMREMRSLYGYLSYLKSFEHLKETMEVQKYKKILANINCEG